MDTSVPGYETDLAAMGNQFGGRAVRPGLRQSEGRTE